MDKIYAVITGVGGYVPDYVLTNDELSRMVDTTDEWIMTRIGVKERRILNEEGLGTSYMARKAAKQLIQRTGVNPDEIDAVVVCTTTPDYHFPSTASILCDKLGLKNAYAFDLQAACCGFLFGLEQVASMVGSGRHKKVILVGADKMSSMVDYSDRATCPIFGDGAAAILVEATTEDLLNAVGGDGQGALIGACGGIRGDRDLHPDILQGVVAHVCGLRGPEDVHALGAVVAVVGGDGPLPSGIQNCDESDKIPGKMRLTTEGINFCSGWK